MSDDTPTLQQWWDGIQAEDSMDKARYFLRNFEALGHPPADVIAFLKTRDEIGLKLHRAYGPEPCGAYTMQNWRRVVQFRIDLASPAARRRDGVAVTVCNDYLVRG